MAKKAKTTDTTLKTWDDLTREFSALGLIEARLSMLNNEVTAMRSQRDEVKKRMEAFVAEHPQDLVNGTKILSTGKVSVSDKPIAVSDDWEATKQYFVSHRMEECFQTDYKLIKGSFNALSQEVLDAAGIRFEPSNAISLKPIPQDPSMRIEVLS